MVTRKSHYGWMLLGGLLCLLGLALMCKLRDGNRAMAQSSPPIPSASLPQVEPPRLDAAPRPLPPIGAAEVSPTLPPPAMKEPTSDIKPTLAVVPAPETPPPSPAASLPPLDKRDEPTAPVIPAPPAALAPAGSEPRPIIIPASGTVPAAPAAPSTPPAPPGSPPPGQGVVPPPAPMATAPEVPAPPVVIPPTPAPALTPPSVTPSVQSNATVPPPSPAQEKLVRPEQGKDLPGEPPLAPTPGEVMKYKVHTTGETLRSLARKTLGNADRWSDIHKLNPTISPDAPLAVGTLVRLPGDACDHDDAESVRPLPTLRSRSAPKMRTVLPLTGTFPLTLDDRKVMTLPQTILRQLGNCETVLVSPGSDKCLWLTNQAHLDRLQSKLDKSPARESDVRGFKRLYYAQTMKVPITEGRVLISDKLAQFAGLGAEVVLVGIDDHFEVWDAARWRRYTQTKKATGDE